LASQDALFKQGSLDFVDALRKDSINPEYIDVESWYRYPQYLVPETKENSFTNVIRDVGKKFLLDGQIVISTENDLTEIIGFEQTLQLYARHKKTGDTIDVKWSVDRPEIATVGANGVLTSRYWGKVAVTATAKDGSELFATITIKVTDPDEPASIIIRSEGDATEIKGIGKMLQFYAENSISGEVAHVDWSVDNIRAASIDSTGLLTSIRLTGMLMVKAVLKSNPDVSATFQINIISIPTGILNSSELDQIKVFPNPANQYVYLEIPCNFKNVSVKIFDITGKIRLIKTELAHGKHTFITEKLPNGIYFLQIITGEDQMVYKIFVSNSAIEK